MAPTGSTTGPVVEQGSEGESLGQRILTTRLEMSAVARRYISQDTFGELVGAETQEEVPFRGATVSRWEAGLQEPSITNCLAIARAARKLGVDLDPGWLMAGSESNAPTPRTRVLDMVRPTPAPRRRGLGRSHLPPPSERSSGDDDPEA